MDKLKRAGEGYWFFFIMSVLWVFSSTLHIVAQLHSEKQDFLLFWNLSLVFWVVTSVALFGAIMTKYIQPEAAAETETKEENVG